MGEKFKMLVMPEFPASWQLPGRRQQAGENGHFHAARLGEFA
ncbi:MAG: hypothetical protein ABSH11_06945 [Verrucomicrobiota bacterium]